MQFCASRNSPGPFSLPGRFSNDPAEEDHHIHGRQRQHDSAGAEKDDRRSVRWRVRIAGAYLHFQEYRSGDWGD